MRIGFYLRRYRLDKLAQLMNALIDSMSLVGSRIIPSPELKQHGQWAMRLLNVCPGLTGLWQASGHSDVICEERVHLDMLFIRSYGSWLDLQIINQTIPVMRSGPGAA